MDTDWDPLDDIFADKTVKNVRVVGKFQPKPKFAPRRKSTAAISVSFSRAVQTIETAERESSDLVGTRNPLENDDTNSVSRLCENDSSKNAGNDNACIHSDLNSECTAPPSEVVPLNIPKPKSSEGRLNNPAISSIVDSTNTYNVAHAPTTPDVLVEADSLINHKPTNFRNKGGVCMHTIELEREEIDVVDSVDLSDLTTKSGQRTRKFQPKPKTHIQKEMHVDSNISFPDSLGSQPLPSEINYTVGDSIPALDDDDVLDLSSVGFSPSVPIESTSKVPLYEEPQTPNEMMDSGIHLESEFRAKLVSCRAKTGKGKAHNTSDPSLEQQKGSTSSQDNQTGRVLRPRKSKSSSSEPVNEGEDIVFANGDVSNDQPGGSGVEDNSKAEQFQQDSVPKVKKVRRRSKRNNEEKEKLEKERKMAKEKSDQGVDAKANENYSNNEQFQQDTEPKVKQVRRKSKRTNEGKEKPEKKHKKSKEKSDQGADAKHNRFSHSTRRKRLLDKGFLETPEDEIDYQKVPLRDLILFAEHKERQRKKEEAAAPATKESNDNSSAAYHNEEENGFRFGQDGEEHNDEEASPSEVKEVIYNYHTGMKRAPYIRWTKQDTELFYEGVRQFGSDFSMIQHLFPNRTRRQIKLKYKKEERSHPLMIREALTSRSQDHSYFERVIERLKQIAAQNVHKDDYVDLTEGEEVVEEDETCNANDEEGKNENIVEEDGNGDAAVEEKEENGIPEKTDGGEDDLFIWSQYKSET